ncbi:MAG TPA: hypothetical protein VKD90_12820, partial [Gemmataceae bacterium]|nr:hypothetical protein [Gemmataceae bacterium]
MRRLFRRRIVLSAIALLLLTGLAGCWLYCHSDAAASLVARKLEEQFGTPVRVDSLSIGVSGTSATGIRVYEHGTDPTGQPFLAVGSADVDVSAVGAATGAMPSALHLRDAHVVLRFDKNGNLVTRLPAAGAHGGSVPSVRIESGTLTLRQEGRADSVFHGIDLTITPVDGRLTVSGTVEDEAWGKWTAEGVIPLSGSEAAWLTLRTVAPQRVTPDLLRQVPFVNPNAWTHVVLSGDTPAQLELTFDSESRRVKYRVALEPTQTTVHIPSIGLVATDAAGSLVAEAGVVTLANVRGRTANGGIRLDARLDFSTPDSDMSFKAEVTDLDVRKLPPNWQLPTQVEGRLSGNLEFRVMIPARGRT